MKKNFHWFISFIQCCLVKFTTERTILEFKIKTIWISIYQTWKNRKTTGAIVPKILKQLPLPPANQITTEVLSTAKDRSKYQDREVQEKWANTDWY